jgi:hypothetical protein
VPRLPVDGKKVIEYRVSLSGVERKALEDLVFANTINKVSTPLVALLSDVSAMALLTAAYLGYRYGEGAVEKMKDKYESAEELYKDVSLIVKSSTPKFAQKGIQDFVELAENDPERAKISLELLFRSIFL